MRKPPLTAKQRAALRRLLWRPELAPADHAEFAALERLGCARADQAHGACEWRITRAGVAALDADDAARHDPAAVAAGSTGGFDHRTLAHVAVYLHRQRAEQYPALVDAGALTPEAARAGLRIARAIAADWRAIARLEPEPDWLWDADRGGAYGFERRNTLTDMAIRAREIATADPSADRSDLADAIEALLASETARPSARWLVDTTLALRAQAAAHRAGTPFTLPLEQAA